MHLKKQQTVSVQLFLDTPGSLRERATHLRNKRG